MLNKIILIGRIATDIDASMIPSGVPVSKFRLAVDRVQSAESKISGQEKQTDFIDIVAWRGTAEFLGNYCGKGRLLAVEGRLQIRQYQAQDGSNRRVTEVVAEQVKALDRAKDGDNQGQQSRQQQQGGRQAAREPLASANYDASAYEYSEIDDPFADQ